MGDDEVLALVVLWVVASLLFEATQRKPDRSDNAVRERDAARRRCRTRVER